MEAVRRIFLLPEAKFMPTVHRIFLTKLMKMTSAIGYSNSMALPGAEIGTPAKITSIFKK